MGQKTVAVQARIMGFCYSEEERIKGLLELQIYLKSTSSPATSMSHVIPH